VLAAIDFKDNASAAREQQEEIHALACQWASNHFPVFDQVDGSKELGDHLIVLTVPNGTSRAVKATGWGVHLPGNKNLVAMAPTTPWETSLPHCIQPGDEATWYLKADDVRRQAGECTCRFGHARLCLVRRRSGDIGQRWPVSVLVGRPSRSRLLNDTQLQAARSSVGARCDSRCLPPAPSSKLDNLAVVMASFFPAPQAQVYRGGEPACRGSVS
jgi:hypothetical protein